MPRCLTCSVKRSKKNEGRPENVYSSALTEILTYFKNDINFIGFLCEMDVQSWTALFDCEIAVVEQANLLLFGWFLN